MDLGLHKQYMYGKNKMIIWIDIILKQVSIPHRYGTDAKVKVYQK